MTEVAHYYKSNNVKHKTKLIQSSLTRQFIIFTLANINYIKYRLN